jgi:predicted nucleic acid-binding protein
MTISPLLLERVVVDATVALAWFLPGPRSIAAHHLMNEARELLSSDVMLSDVARALQRRVAAGDMVADDAQSLLESVQTSPVMLRLSAPFLNRGLEIALSAGVDPGLGVHLALAERTEAALVTDDQATLARLRAFDHQARALLWLGDVV